MVERFGRSDSLRIVEQVASALANIGAALFQSDRLEEALTAFDGVVQSYKRSDAPSLREVVARCFANRGKRAGGAEAGNGSALVLGRGDQGLRGRAVFLDVAEPYCDALMNRAAALHNAGRSEEALQLWSDVVERFGADDRPGPLTMVANAQKHRGALLEQLGRFEEALAVWQQVEDRFGTSDMPEWVALVAGCFQHRCADLFELNRTEEALATCDRAIDRFGQSSAPAVLETVAGILLNKGIVLITAHRNEEALAVWDEIERRFGKLRPAGNFEARCLGSRQQGHDAGPYETGRRDAVEVWSDVPAAGSGRSDASLYHEENRDGCPQQRGGAGLVEPAGRGA